MLSYILLLIFAISHHLQSTANGWISPCTKHMSTNRYSDLMLSQLAFVHRKQWHICGCCLNTFCLCSTPDVLRPLQEVTGHTA